MNTAKPIKNTTKFLKPDSVKEPSEFYPYDSSNLDNLNKTGYDTTNDNFETVELDQAPERDVNDWDSKEIPNYWSQFQNANELIKPNDFNINTFTKVRNNITKAIRKNIEKISMCPDRYNIPRDIKVTDKDVVLMKDLVILTKPLREFIGYINFRFVPKKERRFTYPRLIPQDWLFIADSRIKDIGQGLFVHIPNNFKTNLPQSQRVIESGSYICPYYGVYLSFEEYDNIYNYKNKTDNATYVYTDDVFIDYNDGVNELTNVFYERIYIDGGKYGSLATRSNHSCDDCCNCVIEKLYIPISMDTYRVTWYLKAIKDIHDYEEITWNYGNDYIVKCKGPLGLGCPYLSLYVNNPAQYALVKDYREPELTVAQQQQINNNYTNSMYLNDLAANNLQTHLPTNIYNIADVPIHDIRKSVVNPYKGKIRANNILKTADRIRVPEDYHIINDKKTKKLGALYPYVAAPIDIENTPAEETYNNVNNEYLRRQLDGCPSDDIAKVYEDKYNGAFKSVSNAFVNNKYYIHDEAKVNEKELPFVAEKPSNFLPSNPVNNNNNRPIVQQNQQQVQQPIIQQPPPPSPPSLPPSPPPSISANSSSSSLTLLSSPITSSINYNDMLQNSLMENNDNDYHLPSDSDNSFQLSPTSPPLSPLADGNGKSKKRRRKN